MDVNDLRAAVTVATLVGLLLLGGGYALGRWDGAARAVAVNGGQNPRDSGRHGRRAPCRRGVTAP